MANYSCPFRVDGKCKCNGDYISSDMDYYLCNTSRYEDCPLYKEVMGK
jgi:hypothetical protein